MKGMDAVTIIALAVGLAVASMPQAEKPEVRFAGSREETCRSYTTTLVDIERMSGQIGKLKKEIEFLTTPKKVRKGK